MLKFLLELLLVLKGKHFTKYKYLFKYKNILISEAINGIDNQAEKPYEIKKTFQTNETNINSILISQDGQFVTSSNDNCMIKVWTNDTFELRQSINPDEKKLGLGCELITMSFLNGYNRLVTAHRIVYYNSTYQTRCFINLWDFDTFELKKTFMTDSFDEIHSLIALNENELAISSTNYVIRILDGESLSVKREIPAMTSVFRTKLALFNNRQILASVSALSQNGLYFERDFFIFNSSSLEVKHKFNFTSELNLLVVLKNGFIVSAHDDASIKIWGAKTFELKQIFKTEKAVVS